MTMYPDDADGAVLADLAAKGIDMTLPLSIEFPVAVPDEASANECLAAMTKAGFDSHIYFDEGDPEYDPAVDDADECGPSWTVFADVNMIPDYHEIIRIQAELDRIAHPFGGNSDGWGVMLDSNDEN